MSTGRTQYFFGIRENKAFALVLAAVEKRGTTSGRMRMAVIPDFKAKTINDFLTRNVAPGSTIFTDGLKTFTGLDKIFKHIPRTQPLRSELHQGAKSVVPLADRAIGNLQQWLHWARIDAVRQHPRRQRTL
jgi:transposase-like protein